MFKLELFPLVPYLSRTIVFNNTIKQQSSVSLIGSGILSAPDGDRWGITFKWRLSPIDSKGCCE